MLGLLVSFLGLFLMIVLRLCALELVSIGHFRNCQILQEILSWLDFSDFRLTHGLVTDTKKFSVHCIFVF